MRVTFGHRLVDALLIRALRHDNAKLRERVEELSNHVGLPFDGEGMRLVVSEKLDIKFTSKDYSETRRRVGIDLLSDAGARRHVGSFALDLVDAADLAFQITAIVLTQERS